MTRSTLFSRNRLTLLLIKKRGSIAATGDLLSKNSQYSQENTCVEVGLQFQRLQHRCFPVNTGKFLKNQF